MQCMTLEWILGRRKSSYKRHYWDNCGNLENCNHSKQYCITINFLNLVTALWLCKINALVLQD